MNNLQAAEHVNKTTPDTELLLSDHVKHRLLTRGYTIDIIHQPQRIDGGWLRPLNLRFAGISEHIPLSDCDIEIKDSDIGFSVNATIKNVLKANKDQVDLVNHYWPLYKYEDNGKAAYTIDNEQLPLNGGYFAGFIFAEDSNYELNSKGLERIKSAQYTKERIGGALVKLEKLVDGQFVGTILKKDGKAVKENWFVNKEEMHLNSTIENLLGRALNEQALTQN